MKPQRERTDNVQVDADHHFGVDIVGIELKNPLVIVFCAQSQFEAGDKVAFDHGQVAGFERARPSAGEERIDVVGILLQQVVGLVEGLVRECIDPVADLRIFDYRVMSTEKAVVGVKGGIQQIETEEFPKKSYVKDVVGCNGIGGMLGLDLLEAGERAVVIHNVEELKSFCHLGIAIERVGVNRLPLGLEARQQGKNDSEQHELG